MPFCKFLSCWFWGNCSTMSRVLISSRCNWGHHDSVRLQHYTCIVRQSQRGLDERNPGSRMSWWFRKSLGCDAIPWRRAGCRLFDLLILTLASTNRDGSPQFILCSKRESILLNFENKLSSTGSLAMVKTLVLWLINEVPCEVIGWLSRLPPLQDSQKFPIAFVCFFRLLECGPTLIEWQNLKAFGLGCWWGYCMVLDIAHQTWMFGKLIWIIFRRLMGCDPLNLPTLTNTIRYLSFPTKSGIFRNLFGDWAMTLFQAMNLGPIECSIHQATLQTFVVVTFNINVLTRVNPDTWGQKICIFAKGVPSVHEPFVGRTVGEEGGTGVRAYDDMIIWSRYDMWYAYNGI